MGRLSAYAKNRILKLRFKKNKRIIHIVDILKRDDNIKVSRQAVSTFLKKYLETNSIYDKPRTGRKRKLTQEEIQLIGQVTRLNRDITARAIKEYLNLNVSTYTILRATKLFEWNKANANVSKKANGDAAAADSGSENSPLLTTSLAAEAESGAETGKPKKSKAKITRKYNKRKRADSSVSNANDSFLLNNNTDLDASIVNGDDENGEVEKIQLKPLVDQELKKNINNLDKSNLNTRYEKPVKTRHSVNSIPDFEKVDLNLIPHHELMILKNLSCSPMSFATKILFKIFKIDELHGHNVSGKTLNKNLKAKLPLDPLRVGYIKFLVEKYYDEKECKEMLCGATTHKQDLWKSCHTAINKSILISERKAEAAAAAGKVFVYGDTSLINFADDIKPQANNHHKNKKDDHTSELNSSGEQRKSAKKRNGKKLNTFKYSEGSDSDDDDSEEDDSDDDESDDDELNSSNEHRRIHHDGDDEYDDSDSSFNDTPLSKLKNSKVINKKDASKLKNAKKQLKQKQQTNAKKQTNKKFKANFEHSFSDDDDDTTETSDEDLDDDDDEELDEEIELIQNNRHRNVTKSSSSTTTTQQQPESNLLLPTRPVVEANEKSKEASSEASAAANIAAAMKKRLVVVAAVEKPSPEEITTTAAAPPTQSPEKQQQQQQPAVVVNVNSTSSKTTTANRSSVQSTAKNTVKHTINRRISPPPKSTPPVAPQPAVTTTAKAATPLATNLRSKQAKDTNADKILSPKSDGTDIKHEQTSPKVPAVETTKQSTAKQTPPATKSLRTRQPTTPAPAPAPASEEKKTTIITRSRSLRRN